MIPTQQTVMHDPANGVHGNCLSAVLASLLHIPIEKIPVFHDEERWIKDLNAWLRQYGLAYVLVSNTEFLEVQGIEGVWHEVAGITNRFADVEHACVAKDGNLVFDPSIFNTGLHEIRSYGFFMLLEPWKGVQCREVMS